MEQRSPSVGGWLMQWGQRFLLDHRYFWVLAGVLLLGEAVLCQLIIWRVPYTEIDWVAYMQEVEGYLHGQRDYMQLKGDTGPLVYPAGFVYAYSLLYHLTGKGTDIALAQQIFALLYCINLVMVFAIYRTSKVPPYTIILLCLSKRLHSIFLLRCFNDPVAMMFLYGCVLATVYKRWTAASVLYSLALSIKMNVLLYFPAFGLLMWKAQGAFKTCARLALVLGLAYPFLTTYPQSYMARAFEFSRAFLYRWTVNWKCVDEATFTSPRFAQGLLLGHVVVLGCFLWFKWCQREGGVWRVFVRGFNQARMSVHLDPDHVLTLMFTSNLIGMTFARSLHYQFYAWYFHTLPYLLWITLKPTHTLRLLPILSRLLLMAVIEYCWLRFPATPTSSFLLLLSHSLLLLLLFRNNGDGQGFNKIHIH